MPEHRLVSHRPFGLQSKSGDDSPLDVESMRDPLTLEKMYATCHLQLLAVPAIAQQRLSHAS
jgi:hypothetical protein